jgi:N-acetylneuraminic acid mutarotase
VANVFLLQYINGNIKIENLPSLPFPLANSCGALVGDKIYVAGGLTAPSSLFTQYVFLSFDLNEKNTAWKQLPHWPGPSRMMAVAGAYEDCFYLFSGGQLTDGKREYLRDAYSFSETNGWKKLKGLPFPVAAAPSPAFSFQNELIIMGGDTGKDAAQAATLREKHPGFSDKILTYQVKKDEWLVAGDIFTEKKKDSIEHPNRSVWAPVTTTLVVWKNKIVLPGGEVRPGTRTPNVLIATPVDH